MLFCFHKWKLIGHGVRDEDMEFLSLVPFGKRIDRVRISYQKYKCIKCDKEIEETEVRQ